MVEGDDGRGEMGEDSVDETVHVESADAGRRAVWSEVRDRDIRAGMTTVHSD